MKSPVSGREMIKKKMYVGKSERYPEGLEIDFCEESGGIWLDRDELNKLEDIIEEIVSRRNSMNSSDRENHPRSKFEDDVYENNDRIDTPSKPRKRRESIFGEIFDIFD